MTAVANSLIVLEWSPEEMHFMHPHLSLAKIHAALSYYHEHKEEFDAEIERHSAEIEQMRLAQGETPLKKRLREMGILK